MDDVLGAANYVAQIYFKTTTGRQEAQIDRVGNYLLWYARDMERVKSRKLYLEKDKTEADEAAAGDLQSQGLRTTGSYGVENEGRRFSPLAGNHWKVTEDGMRRVAQSDRILPLKAVIRFKRLQSDFPVQAITDVWTDASGGAGADKVYVVQTGGRIVERCLLMTTDPGDLVLDPTCGSGTTAYVAEQWGRRWLTIDTSRVAVALARQRILTTTFPFFKVKGTNGGDAPVNPSPGFLYKTVPHITLKSIAQNAALDPIFAKHQSILDEKLKALNAVLKRVKKDVRDGLYGKLARKERDEGRKAVTDADRRRWLLPPDNRDRSVKLTVPADFEGWYEWEVPFDADPDWPQEFQDALTAYRQAWRAKMDEVNACIAAHADQEELVDQPEVAKGVVRVAGPFTVEAVMPPEETVDVETPIGGQPEELPTYANAGGQFMSAAPAPAIAGAEPSNAGAYHDKMLRLLKADGVRFPNNKQLAFSRVEACSHGDFIHAEGEWTTEDGKEHRVAVSFGPQLGPVTAVQVEEVLHLASKRGYDDVVFAGFSFDGAAQAAIQGDPNPRVRSHLAHIRPDVNPGMDGLLKETPDSQIFTVFGSPRTDLQKGKDGQYTITMEGVDIYDPVSNTIAATGADKIAAWFVDTDYDGRTFCITQAFFPDKSAWEKLARALKGLIEEDRFAQLSGTVSLSFPAGKHKRAAVKVIDPRGNEVMSVHRLEGKKGYG
jgi:adenine-specific DNA-methyltransferase